MIFIVGVILLALEIFVIPGFGPLAVAEWFHPPLLSTNSPKLTIPDFAKCQGPSAKRDGRCGALPILDFQTFRPSTFRHPD